MTQRRPSTLLPLPVENQETTTHGSQRCPEGFSRLHCEELSGQTDPLEAQARQAQFQDVFLDETKCLVVDGIDVLSVTTTMEAGVDIGALRGVVMANMPPQTVQLSAASRPSRATRRQTRGGAHRVPRCSQPRRALLRPPRCHHR